MSSSMTSSYFCWCCLCNLTCLIGANYKKALITFSTVVPNNSYMHAKQCCKIANILNNMN